MRTPASRSSGGIPMARAMMASRVGEATMSAYQRSKYTLEFAQDGTFSALADCNTVTGTYTTANFAAASGSLTLTPGASTAVACPDGSFADLYTYGLANVSSYAIADGKLTLTLLDDGQLTFE